MSFRRFRPLPEVLLNSRWYSQRRGDVALLGMGVRNVQERIPMIRDQRFGDRGIHWIFEGMEEFESDKVAQMHWQKKRYQGRVCKR